MSITSRGPSANVLLKCIQHVCAACAMWNSDQEYLVDLIYLSTLNELLFIVHIYFAVLLLILFRIIRNVLSKPCSSSLVRKNRP